MPKLPSKEVRAARWIEFAEFMENLKEEKFNHRKWCRPDHTCKTFACVAGWGAINYTDGVKKWIDAAYTYQKLRDKDRTEEESEIYRKASLTYSYEEPLPNDWKKYGKEGLYLAENTAQVLFYPLHSFWFGLEEDSATTKDIALIFRYMATFHGRLGERFNKDRMQKVVDQYNKDRDNAAV
jgi:hypothetical protein